MALWFALVLGLVQGAAEFLPVSSSGHLALLRAFFPGLAPEDGLFFDVVLHLGTLLSLTVVYRRELWGLGKALLTLPFRRGAREEDRRLLGLLALGALPLGLTLPFRRGAREEDRRLLGLLALGALPLGLILPLKGFLERVNGDARFVGAALLANGALLYISDKLIPGRKQARDAKAADALWVGFAQALAVVPGLSRSGSTITAGLLAGFGRSFAVRYSFLLSFPAVLGAGIVKLAEARRAGFDPALLLPCLIGAWAAALSGVLAIRLVRALVDRGRFRPFAFYCWAVGLAAIIMSWMTGRRKNWAFPLSRA